MKKLISIVIPAYNEEDVLDELKRRLQNAMNTCSNYNFEVIIVENGSWDSSFEKLVHIHTEDPRFKIIQLSRNFGCDGGVTAGLQYARGDAAVIMCADLQDIPELIPELIKKWEEGFEIVYAIVQERVGISVGRRISSQLFYKIFNRLTNNTMPENASDFRLIDKKVLRAVNQIGETNRLLRGIIAWTGFKQTGIPFERPPRFAGESKADFITIFKLALNGIFSFSDLPLKIATVLGFIISALSFLLLFIEIALYLIYGREVPGIATIIFVISFLFGMLFLILGVIGEYISRIYDESKKRPLYIVREEIGFGD
ncbi:MAG: glycosyltransferase family 2 protein [Methanoregula sp.]|jgi:dolichol-phosphate mannosyltransferase|uniref:glycosyltransferase family 2 protein n=1 Tax=Methanoregula sp. TaxID=2052170 RepID=UPI003D0B202F